MMMLGVDENHFEVAVYSGLRFDGINSRPGLAINDEGFGKDCIPEAFLLSCVRGGHGGSRR